MKKYRRPSAKIFSALSLIFIVIFVIGLILVFTDYKQIELTIFLVGIGGFIGVLFVILAITEYCSYMQIDNSGIILHRAVRTIENNGDKRTLCKKMELPFSDINNISTRNYKGDGIISKDTTFYVFRLKNGDVFEETFYNYGIQQEAEIINRLRELVNFI